MKYIRLTFIGPCIANIVSEFNQQDATFLKFIYFCKTLYMFQTVFLSTISCTKLQIQRQVFVRPILLPAARLDGMEVGNQVCAADDGREKPSEICRVSCRNK